MSNDMLKMILSLWFRPDGVTSRIMTQEIWIGNNHQKRELLKEKNGKGI